jgi:hypothetical protein
MNLTSMKSQPSQAKSMAEPCEIEPPAYPYGLRISLNNDSLKALGLKVMPPVGSRIEITALAEVDSVSEYERAEQEPQRELSLQITDMSLRASRESGAKALYEGKS